MERSVQATYDSTHSFMLVKSVYCKDQVNKSHDRHMANQGSCLITNYSCPLKQSCFQINPRSNSVFEFKVVLNLYKSPLMQIYWICNPYNPTCLLRSQEVGSLPIDEQKNTSQRLLVDCQPCHIWVCAYVLAVPTQADCHVSHFP